MFSQAISFVYIRKSHRRKKVVRKVNFQFLRSLGIERKSVKLGNFRKTVFDPVSRPGDIFIKFSRHKFANFYG